MDSRRTGHLRTVGPSSAVGWRIAVRCGQPDPGDEPYVVGIDKAKMSAVWGSVVAFTVLLWIGLISYASASIETLNPLSIMGLPALISIGANCFIWYVAVSGGPQLALNPHGLWIRARKWPVKALFLPWESVGRIYVRRAGWGTERSACCP